MERAENISIAGWRAARVHDRGRVSAAVFAVILIGSAVPVSCFGELAAAAGIDCLCLPFRGSAQLVRSSLLPDAPAGRDLAVRATSSSSRLPASGY